MRSPELLASYARAPWYSAICSIVTRIVWNSENEFPSGSVHAPNQPFDVVRREVDRRRLCLRRFGQWIDATAGRDAVAKDAAVEILRALRVRRVDLEMGDFASLGLHAVHRRIRREQARRDRRGFSARRVCQPCEQALTRSSTR
jgi:hypothetical protein